MIVIIKLFKLIILLKQYLIPLYNNNVIDDLLNSFTLIASEPELSKVV